jgi:hypothetical protein
VLFTFENELLFVEEGFLKNLIKKKLGLLKHVANVVG